MITDGISETQALGVQKATAQQRLQPAHRACDVARLRGAQDSVRFKRPRAGGLAT